MRFLKKNLVCFLSFSVNFFAGLIELIMSGKGAFLGFLTRKTMETAKTFDDAKKLLTDTQLIAPVYFILAGNTSDQVRIPYFYCYNI